MVAGSPLCVALDATDRATILGWADATEPHVGLFKIGLAAFGACGPDIVRELSGRRPLFLDLKFHDIPATIEAAVGAISGLGARYTTVHASAGADAVKAAAAAAGPDLSVLGVTILTSLDEMDLERVGIAGPIEDAVLRLGELALGAGAEGLVCSPLEVAALRARFGPQRGGPILVVPGIRPAGALPSNDQRRTMTPRETLDAGADVIVVGRPITGADDPGASARALEREIGG
ncbi:MAG: orotidine-5'-phosphate decarboxylase [Actinomycetota bacterium]